MAKDLAQDADTGGPCNSSREICDGHRTQEHLGKILDTIDEAIRLRDKVLIVLSEASIASDWVEDEVTKAFEEEAAEGWDRAVSCSPRRHSAHYP